MIYFLNYEIEDNDKLLPVMAYTYGKDDFSVIKMAKVF